MNGRRDDRGKIAGYELLCTFVRDKPIYWQVAMFSKYIYCMYRQTNGQDINVDQEACSVENTKTADQMTEGSAELGAVTAK